MRNWRAGFIQMAVVPNAVGRVDALPALGCSCALVEGGGPRLSTNLAPGRATDQPGTHNER